MNRHQRSLLIESVTVVGVTVIAIAAIVNLKDLVNRSEAMRAMRHLSAEVQEYQKFYREQYRKKYGKEYSYAAVPPESELEDMKEHLPGYPRLGKLHYRAIWINFESTPDEILAYAEHRSWLFGNGAIVLRLDGQVEWMQQKQFRQLLAQQQSPEEAQMERE